MADTEDTTFFTGSAANVLYVPKEDDRLIMTGKGKYVRHDVVKGTYQSTADAILPATTDHDEDIDIPIVVAAPEEDIQARLANARRPTFTLQIGVAWATDEMTTLFCFDESIIEYRNNIGVESSKKNALTGTAPCYMKTYASVGVPERRVAWLITRLSQININAGLAPKDTPSNGYYWFNANITRDYIPPLLMRTGPGDADVRVFAEGDTSIVGCLKNLKKNIIGIAATEISLKRSPNYAIDGKRYITLSLKSFQVYDITDTSSPPLSRAIEFEAGSRQTSERVLNMLRGKSKQTESGERVMMPVGATTVA